MTDLLDLQLTMDVRQFVAGGKAASSSLEDISRKTLQANDSQLRFEGNVGRLYSRGGALGGVLQVSQGIGNLTQNLARGSIEAAAFGAAFVAMEIGKTAQDFREMTDAVAIAGKTATITTVEYDALGVAITRTATVAQTTALTGFQKFLFVLKANPLLTAVAALTAIATAVQLIGSNAKEAAGPLDNLFKSGQDLAARRKTGGSFGEIVTRQVLQQEQGRLPDIATQIYAGKSAATVADLAQALGLSNEQIVAKLEEFELGKVAPNRQFKPYVPGITAPSTAGGIFGGDFAKISFTKDAAAQFLAAEYDRLEKLLNPKPAEQEVVDLGFRGFGDFGFSRSTIKSLNPTDRKEREFMAELEGATEAGIGLENSMDRVYERATEVGQVLAASFAQAAGTAEDISDTMRQMFQSFILQRVQAGLQGFVSGGVAAIAGSSRPGSGQTPTQRFTPGPLTLGDIQGP